MSNAKWVQAHTMLDDEQRHPPERQTPRPVSETEPDRLEKLIAGCKESQAPRVRMAATHAETAIARLKAMLKEERGRLEAEAEVDRLYRELATAKARLRGPRARSGERGPNTTKKAAVGVSYKAVWEWAETKGYPVKRGRPPTALVEQYRREHAA